MIGTLIPGLPGLIKLRATRSRIVAVSCSLMDQGFSVGAVFLANIVLARTQTKQEYGIFTLAYSVFTFLAGLHNAYLLEPYTVYGSGKYSHIFPDLLGTMKRANLFVTMVLTAIMAILWIVLSVLLRREGLATIFGLTVSIAVLLSAIFLRRTFYICRKPALAAGTSIVFFVVVVAGLGLLSHLHAVSGLSVFLLLATAWLAGIALFARHLPSRAHDASFDSCAPEYWKDHWKYAKWVLATAFVFQLTTQGYYWIIGALGSAKDVADLRAMYIVVAPFDQIFIALSYLVLPIMSFRYSTRAFAGVLSVWRWYIVAVLCISGSFALFVQATGRHLLHLFYGSKFDSTLPLLALMCYLPLIQGIGSCANDGLKSAGRPAFAFYGYVASGIICVLVGVPLVSHLGLRGAVYGLMLSGAAYSAVLIAALLKLALDTKRSVTTSRMAIQGFDSRV